MEYHSFQIWQVQNLLSTQIHNCKQFTIWETVFHVILTPFQYILFRNEQSNQNLYYKSALTTKPVGTSEYLPSCDVYVALFIFCLL